MQRVKKIPVIIEPPSWLPSDRENRKIRPPRALGDHVAVFAGSQNDWQFDPQAENNIGRPLGTGPRSPSYGLSAVEGFDRQVRQGDQTVLVHPGDRPAEVEVIEALKSSSNVTPIFKPGEIRTPAGMSAESDDVVVAIASDVEPESISNVSELR